MEFEIFDAAKYLTSEEAMIAYLNDALEDDDPKMLLLALNTVARAQGMIELSKKSGLPRESLYRALSSNGNPNYSTFMKILAGLGFSLRFQKANLASA